jgi:hypothetical protein
MKPDGKVRRIRRLVITEGSLVDRPANPGCAVLLFKNREREKGRPAMDVQKILAQVSDPTQRITKSDCSDLIADHLAQLAPDLSPGEALWKFWRDPFVQSAYQLHEECEAEGDDE